MQYGIEDGVQFIEIETDAAKNYDYYSRPLHVLPNTLNELVNSSSALAPVCYNKGSGTQFHRKRSK
jgi:hypothetical protein